MFEQQNPTLIVKNHRPGRDHETSLAGAYQTTTDERWQTPPNGAEKFDEHWRGRISRQANFKFVVASWHRLQHDHSRGAAEDL
jgi:hypothetical protein